MLLQQKAFLDYVNEVKKKVGEVDFSREVIESFKFDILEKSISEIELLVPIMGAFSAGKSSLLNSFLEHNYLPVGITPETALATELRYSVNEYIEAVKANGDFDKYAVTDFEKIKKKASEYKFLRLYANNANLKSIEPLILVDMPGFESPLDLHNQAIFEYINRGTHYIVMTSVEEGTVTRSMLRQLSEIQIFGRDFSFILSKTNLRAPSEIKEVVETIQEQIQDHFNLSKDVQIIDDNGGSLFQNVLSKIDIELLFYNLFIFELKENYYKVTEAINTLIVTLGKDKINNEQDLVGLRNALDGLIKERDSMVQEANEKYTDINVNRIVESVGNTLTKNVDELTSAAIGGGNEGLSQTITDMVRYSLVNELKTRIGEIGNDIVKEFSFSLSEKGKSGTGFLISEELLKRITDSTHNIFNSVNSGMKNYINQRNSNLDATQIYKTVTTVLAVATDVIAPMLEIVLIFLPDLLAGVMEHFQKVKQEKEIRNTIFTQIIPAMKRELRSKLPAILNQQVQEMIINISAQFEEGIRLKQETIASTQKTLEEKNIDIDKAISDFKKISQDVMEIAKNILFVGAKA